MENFRCMGNLSLLHRPITAFFCSRDTQESLFETILRWVYELVPEHDCVICTNQSFMEQAVFRLLLKRKIPVIWALAEGFEQIEWSDPMKQALAEERLLAVTLCDDKVHWPTRATVRDRNRQMISLADKIVIGYRTPGGNLDWLTHDLPNVRLLVCPFDED